MRSRTIAAMALGTTALLALTGCGPDAKTASGPSSSPSPGATDGKLDSLPENEILDRAAAAMDNLQSVHVTGGLPYAADKTAASGSTSVKVDISFDRKGNCSGTIQAEGLGSVTVIRSPELLHIKGDADFWRNIARQRHATPKQENALVGTFAARWMKMPRSNPQSSQMAAVCDQMDAVTGIGASAVEVRKDGISLIDGKTTVAVSAKTSEGTEETYWIATQGTPYFLKALSSGGKDGEVAYSAFDAPVDTAPPAGADVLDLSKAGAGEGS